ncbi:hypothetical protein RJT34_27445 [Clitoria ternatea]|uniref:VQ domain-containing protein n=1 Tax=Clitoria ternatea TaxID=43366 RepID=A0AAN9IC26_CLITE
MLGVNNHVMKGKKQGKRNCKKDIKVTYISSPMKVEICASKFRELVQELTGQDSNVAEVFVEPNYDSPHGGDGVHHKGSSTQQWSGETYLPDTNWLKPDYNHFLHMESSMYPLNGHSQYELLNLNTL